MQAAGPYGNRDCRAHQARRCLLNTELHIVLAQLLLLLFNMFMVLWSALVIYSERIGLLVESVVFRFAARAKTFFEQTDSMLD